MEVFFMAGLSPFLTLYEVFSNPSRTARFLTAFYSYVEKSENHLWSLLQPCIHNGILAPTTEQRLKYADWLFVWAKECTSMPYRMAQLVDQFHLRIDTLAALDITWSRNSPDIQLFDVFEPSFLASGLQAETNLGHLIFGEAGWLSAGGKRSKHDDPITSLYRKHGLLGSPTMLKSDFYSPLFLPHGEFRGKKSSHRPTFTFHSPKEMWSITRDFPENSHWSSDPIIPDQLLETNGKLYYVIKSIVTSSLGVSIGPLEYCGVGHIVYLGPTAHVAVCKGDPIIPKYHEERNLCGQDQISSHLDASGKRKRGRTEKENNQLNKKLAKLDAGYKRVEQQVDAGDGVEVDLALQPDKPKRRRLGPDQRLSLGLIL
ncbi:hypothetical protein B0H10DRAFT_2231409 [Mycena sp. CBHHK59/15]|nr:hypothetical protein B0H10DRAFT_2231409 [Mycena sp. CBHHK59/15]